MRTMSWNKAGEVSGIQFSTSVNLKRKKVQHLMRAAKKEREKKTKREAENSRLRRDRDRRTH